MQIKYFTKHKPKTKLNTFVKIVFNMFHLLFHKAITIIFNCFFLKYFYYLLLTFNFIFKNNLVLMLNTSKTVIRK